MNILTRLILIIFPLLSCTSVRSQIDLNEGSIVQDSFFTTVPFEYVRGKVILQVMVENRLRKFIFDTGAPLMLFESLVEEIGVEPFSDAPVIDAAGGAVSLSLAKVRSFQIGGVEFQNIPALVLPAGMAGLLSCWQIDGIIGSNAVRDCIVRIDQKRKLLTLTNDLGKLDLSNSSVVPVHLDEEQRNPYLEISLFPGGTVLANFDSGSEDVFSISIADATRAKARGFARVTGRGYGKMAVSLTDSQQRQTFEEVTFDQLLIGSTRFSGVTSTASEEQDYSVVGIGLSAYGIITIDFLHKQFYFQSYSDQKQIEAEPSSTLGFNIFPEGKTYIIGIVWEGSPAERSGLKSGYRVLQIEGLDFTERTPDLDCKLLLEEYTQRAHLSLQYLDDQGQLLSVRVGSR